MFKKIVVPLDLTDRHQPVLKVAAELAVQSGGEVILLHVVESIVGWEDKEIEKFYRRLENTAREHLDRCGRHFDEKKISWHSRVTTGPRAREIARYCDETNADLIIVSAPRIEPENPARGWASLSWKVGLLASCPVLLVK